MISKPSRDDPCIWQSLEQLLVLIFFADCFQVLLPELSDIFRPVIRASVCQIIYAVVCFVVLYCSLPIRLIAFLFISGFSEFVAFVCISDIFCCFYTFACAGVVQLLQCWVSGASLGFLGCFSLFSTASVNPNWIQGKHFHSTSLCSASLLVQASFVDFAVGLQNPCFSLNLFRPGHHGGDASHGLLQPRRFAVFV